MQLKTLILPIVLSLPLLGCGLVYKIDIPQGNYLEAKQVDQLRRGMTQEQVRFLLGNPMSLDSFNHDRWVYLYYFKPGRGEVEQKQLVLEFNNDALLSVSGDFAAPAEFNQGL
ncbi:outer membrane protein assembly factor BamE [Oceanisphaera avium]|uniref:Outer membrane protein assembly factor BamE n=1 Tax=Oceanisphaera avium TaxID=1903694 RepID=A0A1Y0CWI4_9GAMM|nr:outer membrane protein assembly factor BamE [Oceanisphaera avium]ART79609.1 outer membrane assembly protein BamE [Oceanisphaera avium]